MASPSSNPNLHHDHGSSHQEKDNTTSLAWLWGILILLAIAIPAWWWVRNSNDEPGTSTLPSSSQQTSESQPGQAGQ